MINPPTMELFDDPEIGYRLKASMQVQCPIDRVFDFFSDAANLEAITPPWLNFQILTPMPLQIAQGALLDYKIRLHYVPIKWRTEICVWKPPYQFVDQQLKGPYKKWYHQHTFEDVGNGITTVNDDVHYIPRGGRLIHRFLVKPDLIKIFKYRQDKLTEIFAAGIGNASPDSAKPNQVLV